MKRRLVGENAVLMQNALMVGYAGGVGGIISWTTIDMIIIVACYQTKEHCEEFKNMAHELRPKSDMLEAQRTFVCWYYY